MQVKDNWGWCNGNHKVNGTVEDKEGYYADDIIIGNDCLGEKAKEFYDGDIYIIP